ncbi:hypothetical protein E2C01_025926 [Portunus trituberculatus]|uniref:Uncharacterized protein n=1 Tax=Portunus trituberculatus TaxID=210409 RepID=A0A5B7EH13_PORTR|nr:hypothetical protein [Portunus trituberculatus]
MPSWFLCSASYSPHDFFLQSPPSPDPQHCILAHLSPTSSTAKSPRRHLRGMATGRGAAGSTDKGQRHLTLSNP